MSYNEGNWAPVAKELVNALPKSGPYSLVDAVVSYQVDVNNGTVKSLRDYSRIWSWSMSKVINLIRYKKGTVLDHLTNKRRTVKFRIIGELEDNKGHLSNKSETKAEQTQDTTIREEKKEKKKLYASPSPETKKGSKESSPTHISETLKNICNDSVLNNMKENDIINN